MERIDGLLQEIKAAPGVFDELCRANIRADNYEAALRSMERQYGLLKDRLDEYKHGCVYG